VTKRLQALAPPPGVLLHQRGAKFGEPVRAVLERSVDAFAVVDLERQDARFVVDRAGGLRGGGFVDKLRQSLDVVEADGDAGERERRGSSCHGCVWACAPPWVEVFRGERRYVRGYMWGASPRIRLATRQGRSRGDSEASY
jgi:hypothetical protein